MVKTNDSEWFLRARQIGTVSTFPFLLAGGPLIGYVLGDWVDRRFGFGPYGKAVLMLLGFFGALNETFRMIRELRESENDGKKSGS